MMPPATSCRTVRTDRAVSLGDQDKLELIISALQSIAAYPDVSSIGELQAVVRQRLSAMPAPRHAPESVDVITEEYHPRHLPPTALPPAPRQGQGFADLTPTVCLAPVCCAVYLPPACSCTYLQGLTGFKVDEFGRLQCLQYVLIPLLL